MSSSLSHTSPVSYFRSLSKSLLPGRHVNMLANFRAIEQHVSLKSIIRVVHMPEGSSGSLALVGASCAHTQVKSGKRVEGCSPESSSIQAQSCK